MNLFLLKEYIRYFHRNTDEHSLHSPFFYQFYTEVVKSYSLPHEWANIEAERSKLLRNDKRIKIFDLGAGSKVNTAEFRKIKCIAKYSLSSPKFSQFLFRLIQQFNCNTIIELGTSLGINTSYLAKANPKGTVNTFEADQNIVNIAKEVNKKATNISFNVGDIGKTLPRVLQQLDSEIDFVYADANHTYKASVEYYDALYPYLSSNAIFIVDDIYWSKGMKRAWLELRNRKEITSSIDLFDAGLLFFNNDLKKQHHILSF